MISFSRFAISKMSGRVAAGKQICTGVLALTLAACQTAQVRSTEKQASPSIHIPLFADQTNRQVVVVTTADWNATSGVLRRFEWTKGDWQQVGKDVRVVVGKNGLGWGVGLHNFPKRAGESERREGDNKAPAGLFRLTQAMGYAAEENTQLPYTQITIYHECVDDTASAQYNHVVDTRQMHKTWSSWEEMKRNDELYRYLVVVDHNGTQPSEKPIPGKGSCIFMHVWRSQEDGVKGTAGCTAMPAENAAELMHWLKPGAVLAQFPQRVYVTYRQELGLPQLPVAKQAKR
ncbi:MAG: L,D-transpeptidase family protein [Myxococcota bacterium]